MFPVRILAFQSEIKKFVIDYMAGFPMFCFSLLWEEVRSFEEESPDR